MLGGKRLRIYYMAQVETAPPKFIFFVNSAALMVDSYKKYLYNQFREEYDFTGVPLQMHLKGKAKKREDEGAIKPQKPDRLSHKNEHLTEVGDKDEFDIIDEDSEF